MKCILIKQFLNIQQKFPLELGGHLLNPTNAYTTLGTLSPKKDNVVWVFHALTAASNAEDWWSGLIGKGKVFDPEKHFIVCANILGSCYGSTGPNSVNPETGKMYLQDFPAVTIRDIVNSFVRLRKHLGIEKINFAIGGSCGGYQLLEWLVIEPEVIVDFCALVTTAKETPWGVAIHTAHRSAIENDPTWKSIELTGGLEGMKTARQIGLLFYRNHNIYDQLQKEDNTEVTKDFKATSYLKYQGEKLAKRFNPISYYKLTEVLDTHNLTRGRDEDITKVLSSINQRGLIISVSSDILCPPEEQKFIAKHIPNAKYVEIDSLYGHDGFLLEFEKIGEAIQTRFPRIFS